jgi:hypothetical protein
VYQTSTDDQAIAELFHFRAQPLDAGDIVGDLYVNGVLEVTALHLSATPNFRPEVLLRTIDVSVSP